MTKNQNKTLKVVQLNTPQAPANTEGEGGSNTPDLNANTADKTGVPQAPLNTEGEGNKDDNGALDLNANKEDQLNTPQAPANTEGEGGSNTPDLNANTADKTGIPQAPANTEGKTEDDDVAYVAMRPLLHGGKPYKAGEDVTGLFSEDEADRLLKMGVIEKA